MCNKMNANQFIPTFSQLKPVSTVIPAAPAPPLVEDYGLRSFCVDAPVELFANKIVECPQILRLTYGDAGDSLLHLVLASQNNAQKLQFLLNVMPVNIANLEGATPLHVAAGNGDANAVSQLLAYGAAADAQDDEDETPLYWAVREGHSPVVEILLRAGADPNIANTDDELPLELAQLSGETAIVQLLLPFTKFATAAATALGASASFAAFLDKAAGTVGTSVGSVGSVGSGVALSPYSPYPVAADPVYSFATAVHRPNPVF